MDLLGRSGYLLPFLLVGHTLPSIRVPKRRWAVYCIYTYESWVRAFALMSVALGADTLIDHTCEI